MSEEQSEICFDEPFGTLCLDESETNFITVSVVDLLLGLANTVRQAKHNVHHNIFVASSLNVLEEVVAHIGRQFINNYNYSFAPTNTSHAYYFRIGSQQISLLLLLQNENTKNFLYSFNRDIYLLILPSNMTGYKCSMCDHILFYNDKKRCLMSTELSNSDIRLPFRGL